MHASRTAFRRLGAICLAFLLLLPRSAQSAPAGDPVVAEVKALYDEGKARYETLDYVGAIDLWTKAYGKLPNTVDNAPIRNNLVYNIATAQEKAYELDRDSTHLRQARGLLQRYLDDYRASMKGPEASAEISKVEARIAKLDAALAGSTGVAPAPVPPPTQPAVVAPPPRPLRVKLDENPELKRQYEKGRAMIIGGSVALGLGAGALLAALVVATSAQWRAAVDAADPNEDLLSKGEKAVAATLFVLGVGGVVAGAVLLPLGLKKRKNVVNQARSMALSPMPLRSGAGVAFGMRF